MSLQTSAMNSPLSFIIPPVDTDDMHTSPFSLTPLGSNSPASSFLNLTAPTNSEFPSAQPLPTVPDIPLPPTTDAKFHGPMKCIPTFLDTQRQSHLKRLHESLPVCNSQQQ